MEFTQQQKDDIEKLAGLNYTVKQVAMYLDISSTQLYNEYENHESEFYYHYERGKLIVAADVDKSLIDDAKDGNLTAIAILKKAQKSNRLNNLKNELFGI